MPRIYHKYHIWQKYANSREFFKTLYLVLGDARKASGLTIAGSSAITMPKGLKATMVQVQKVVCLCVHNVCVCVYIMYVCVCT